ncbi:leucine-rich repeat transmembrane protein kinase protein [Tanacetum coccineum]
MTETMEKYMSKTHGNYGSGVVRPKINDKTHFELKGQFLKELCENTFSGSEHEDANKHIEKVLEIVDLFHIPKLMQDQVMLQAFLMSLTGAASRWLRNEPSGSITNWETLKTKFLNKSDANYAQAYITQRTVHLRKKGKLLKRLTTHSLEHPINLEDSIEQQGQDSTNRHEENSNIIKEIRASIDAAIRNQGALIKTLEIQIDQMSKVLQERGIKGLPGSTEPNPKDHVKSISTAKADSSVIFRIGSGPYVVSDSQYSSLSFETVPFPSRLHGYCCDDWKEASLVGLRASVSVMPFSTYSNLGLGDLAHTRLTIELADRTIKHPRGITENVLVRIGKFIFPIDFVILDIPEDDDVLLILRRPFLSTAHAKIDIFKRKFTLRVEEEKLVFKSIKPATSIIKRVYMVKNKWILSL